MSFENFAEVLWMGGHGPYVWLAHGVTVLLLLWNALVPWRAMIRWRRRVAAQRRRAMAVER